MDAISLFKEMISWWTAAIVINVSYNEIWESQDSLYNTFQRWEFLITIKISEQSKDILTKHI